MVIYIYSMTQNYCFHCSKATLRHKPPFAFIGIIVVTYDTHNYRGGGHFDSGLQCVQRTLTFVHRKRITGIQNFPRLAERCCGAWDHDIARYQQLSNLKYRRQRCSQASPWQHTTHKFSFQHNRQAQLGWATRTTHTDQKCFNGINVFRIDQHCLDLVVTPKVRRAAATRNTKVTLATVAK